MSYDHSECAALFGLCECEDCQTSRKPAVQKPRSGTIDLDKWALFTIRSADVRELLKHRLDMLDMGFSCESIEASQGWAQHCLPPGYFFFSAKIPKAKLSAEQFEGLCKWDRIHGRLPGEK